MDLLGNFGAWIFWLAGYVVPFVFVLAIVVFFHELGHFLMARWCGVRVLTFSIGFGPELMGVNDRHGTRWKVCAIPLGGYVKFFGDRNVASIGGADSMNVENPNETFLGATVGRRIAIAVAGPMANFLIAILVFATVFMWYGRETTIARVEAVVPNSAAAVAGIEPGDLIVAIDGNTIESFDELVRVVSASASNKIKILVDRILLPREAPRNNAGTVQRIDADVSEICSKLKYWPENTSEISDLKTRIVKLSEQISQQIIGTNIPPYIMAKLNRCIGAVNLISDPGLPGSIRNSLPYFDRSLAFEPDQKLLRKNVEALDEFLKTGSVDGVTLVTTMLQILRGGDDPDIPKLAKQYFEVIKQMKK